MSSLLSRVAVAAAGLPIVLFAAYYGSWALLVVVAVVAVLALHELYQMARGLRPLVLAGYAGAVGAVVGASMGGAEWMLGGVSLALLLSFVFAAVSQTRQSTTVAVGDHGPRRRLGGPRPRLPGPRCATSSRRAAWRSSRSS